MTQNARVALWVPSDENPTIGQVIAAEQLSTPAKVINTKFANAAGIPDAPTDGLPYVRQSAAWIVLPPPTSIDWANVDNKPTSFPPTAHGHPISDVTGLQTALDAKATITYVDTADAMLQAAINTKLGDAPSDGQYYSRRNAAWVVPPGGLSDAPSDGSIYGRKDGAWVNTLPALIDGGTF